MRYKGSRVARIKTVLVDLSSVCGDVQNSRYVHTSGTRASNVKGHSLLIIVVRDVQLLDGDVRVRETGAESRRG